MNYWALSLSWFQCRVCKRWRPFEKTGVNKKILRDNKGTEIGSSNVVFCSDIENCIKNASKYHHGVNNEN